MIGLVASVVSAAVLKSWIPLTAALAYILSIKGRKTALLGFSLYLTSIIADPGFDSVYTIKGQREFILLGMTTLLVLNDILQGKALVEDKRDILLAGALAISAVNDYTLFAALISTAVYKLYESFGKAALYFLTWLSTMGIILLALKGKLPGIAAETFVIGALGLLAVVVGGIRDINHAEV